MFSRTLVLAAAVSGLMAGAAFAQNSSPSTYPDKALTPPDQVQNAPFSPNTASSAPSTNDITPQAKTGAESNVSATVPETSLPAGSTITDELVTNGPVPDTQANRAKYGGPDSRAGKLTRAAGN